VINPNLVDRPDVIPWYVDQARAWRAAKSARVAEGALS